MIVEQRTYTVHVGKTEEYIELYQQQGLPVALEVLGNLLGYFRSEIGPLNQIVHMWGYESMNDRESRRAELRSREGWQQYVAQSRPLIQQQESKILIPTSFSPIR